MTKFDTFSDIVNFIAQHFSGNPGEVDVIAEYRACDYLQRYSGKKNILRLGGRFTFDIWADGHKIEVKSTKTLNKSLQRRGIVAVVEGKEWVLKTWDFLIVFDINDKPGIFEREEVENLAPKVMTSSKYAMKQPVEKRKMWKVVLYEDEQKMQKDRNKSPFKGMTEAQWNKWLEAMHQAYWAPETEKWNRI